jgi:hypothetical protein
VKGRNERKKEKNLICWQQDHYSTAALKTAGTRSARSAEIVKGSNGFYAAERLFTV